MDQNREPRNKPSHVRSMTSDKGAERMQWAKNSCGGTSGSPHAKSEVGPLPHAKCKYELKWIKDVNIKDKTLRRKHRGKWESFMTLIWHRYPTE